MEKPIGLIIKEIIEEKNIRVSEISEQLGISRQAIYNTYTRDRFKRSEYEKWANVLGITVEELKMKEGNLEIKSSIVGTSILDEIQKLLSKELREKNEQIKALQEALKESQQIARESQQLAMALLGKSPEYSTQTPVIPYKPQAA